jgi:non-ribosomal peptide synthetase component E (peptide arylation enzyme)
VQGSVTLSYAQLAELVSQVAVYLHERGVQPDEVVGVALPGGIDHAVLTFALLRAGASRW